MFVLKSEVLFCLCVVGLYYKWFCVYSLCQCIQELNKESATTGKTDISQKKGPPPNFRNNDNFFFSDFKHHVNRSSTNHQSSQLFGRQTTQQGFLNHDHYNYGNLAWPTKWSHYVILCGYSSCLLNSIKCRLAPWLKLWNIRWIAFDLSWILKSNYTRYYPYDWLSNWCFYSLL